MTGEERREYQRMHNRRSYEKYKDKYSARAKEYRQENVDNGLCSMGCGAPLHWSNKNYCIEHSCFRGKHYGHGVKLDGRLMLYARQNGECAICKKFFEDPMELGVDHDHKTGYVRGLLCRHCNGGIGMFLDSTDILMSAHKYLEERK